MAKSDNPAGRLYLILEAAQSSAKSEMPQREVWARVFEVDPADTTSLLAAYLNVINLARTAKEAVRQLHDIDQAIYQNPFERLEHGFTVNSFNHQWNNFAKYLDAATMTALSFCSDTLSNRVGETIITEENLADLQEAVESLLEKVLTADDMAEELKLFLVERLEDIRRAILTYRIWGAAGLKEALERTVGAMYIYPDFVPDDDHKGDFTNVVEKLSKLVTLALKAKELVVPQITALLESGP